MLALSLASCGGLLGIDDLEFRSSDNGGSAGEGAGAAGDNAGAIGGTNDTMPSGGTGSGDSGTDSGGDSGANGQGGSGGKSTGGSPATGGRGGAEATGGGSSGSSNAGAGSGGEGGSGNGESPVLTAIPLPPGYRAYCSVRDAALQDFDFSWADVPCEDIIQRTGWSDGHNERTGIFDTAARSSVVILCDVNKVFGIFTFAAPGVRALELARTWALEGYAGEGCVFVAAPQSLPVFSAPFSLEPLPRVFEMSNRGYDFATAPGSPSITATICRRCRRRWRRFPGPPC